MNRSFSFNFSSLIGLVLLVIFGYFLFSIAKFIYIILLYASPVLLIGILFLKKELLISFFQKMWYNIRQNPWLGILNALVSILFLPFSLLGMTIKAIISKKIEKIQKDQYQEPRTQSKNEYIDFEDLTEIKKERQTLQDWDMDKWDKTNKH